MSLNVTTIYFNSIEIEWKPGGISDVLYYIVKYRPQPKSYVYNMLRRDEQHISTENTNQHDSSDMDLDENNFKSINTTNTKLKVGTSLKPYSFYEFKVQAGNLLGLSEETDVIRVRTAPTSKESVI